MPEEETQAVGCSQVLAQDTIRAKVSRKIKESRSFLQLLHLARLSSIEYISCIHHNIYNLGAVRATKIIIVGA